MIFRILFSFHIFKTAVQISKIRYAVKIGLYYDLKTTL